MRKHIAKALQARSKAVKNAIERYNTAAVVLEPPMAQLTWEQVVDYAFLADFDILRDTRAEVQSRPWTRPSYRLAMDSYFKILRAREEIRRLNIEIRRVITWIPDENRILRVKESELMEVEGKMDEEVEGDQQMAVQVRLYRERRGRFNDTHMRRFWALRRLPGFTGTLTPGVSLELRAVRRAARQAERDASGNASQGSDDEMDIDRDVSQTQEEGWEDEDEEDEGVEAADEVVSGLIYQITKLAMDEGTAGDSDAEA